MNKPRILSILRPALYALSALLVTLFPAPALYALDADEQRALNLDASWYVRSDSQFAGLGDTEISPAPAGPGQPPPAAGDGSVESNKAIARGMLAQYGWDTDEQWNCLELLWQSESGWSHTADNPSSSAYGIPQALVRTHKANIDENYQGYYETETQVIYNGNETYNYDGGNPAVQIRWGMDYITSRADYGNPCNAWTLWQRRDPHWY